MPRFAVPPTPIGSATKPGAGFSTVARASERPAPDQAGLRVEQKLEHVFDLAASPMAPGKQPQPAQKREPASVQRTTVSAFSTRFASPWAQAEGPAKSGAAGGVNSQSVPPPAGAKSLKPSSQTARVPGQDSAPAALTASVGKRPVAPLARGQTVSLEAPFLATQSQAQTASMTGSASAGSVDVATGVADLLRKLNTKASKPLSESSASHETALDASQQFLQKMANSFRPCWGPNGMLVTVAAPGSQSETASHKTVSRSNQTPAVPVSNDNIGSNSVRTSVVISKIDLCPQVPAKLKRGYHTFLGETLSSLLQIHAKLNAKYYNEFAQSSANGDIPKSHELPWWAVAAKPIKPSENTVRRHLDEFVERSLIALYEQSIVPGSVESDAIREWTRSLALIRSLVSEELLPGSSSARPVSKIVALLGWLRHATSSSLKRRINLLDQFESLFTDARTPNYAFVSRGMPSEILLGARVFALLSHLRVVEAAEVAQKGGDLHLALLISRIGATIVDPTSTATSHTWAHPSPAHSEETKLALAANPQFALSEQIKKWKASGQWNLVERWHQRVYALLAGDFSLLLELCPSSSNVSQGTAPVSGHGQSVTLVDDDMCFVSPSMQQWMNQLALVVWTLTQKEWTVPNPAAVVLEKYHMLTERFKMIKPYPEYVHGYLTPHRLYNRTSAAYLVPGQSGSSSGSDMIETSAYQTDKKLWSNVQAKRLLTLLAVDPVKTVRPLTEVREAMEASSLQSAKGLPNAFSALGAPARVADRTSHYNLLGILTRGHQDPTFALLKLAIDDSRDPRSRFGPDVVGEIFTAPLDSPSPTDVALRWILSELLTPAIALAEHRATQSLWQTDSIAPRTRYQRVLTGTFLAQLEALGLWHWAVYVGLRSLHLHPLERRRLAQEIIARHVFDASAGQQWYTGEDRIVSLTLRSIDEYRTHFFDEGDFAIPEGGFGEHALSSASTEVASLAQQITQGLTGGSERVNLAHPFALSVNEVTESAPTLWKNLLLDLLARQYSIQLRRKAGGAEQGASTELEDSSQSSANTTGVENTFVPGESCVVELQEDGAEESELDVYFPATESSEDRWGAGSPAEGFVIDYEPTLRNYEKEMLRKGIILGPRLEGHHGVELPMLDDGAEPAAESDEMSPTYDAGANLGFVEVAGQLPIDAVHDCIAPPALVCISLPSPSDDMDASKPKSLALEDDDVDVGSQSRLTVAPRTCLSLWSLTPGLSAYSGDGGSRVVPKIAKECVLIFSFLCQGARVPRSWLEEACAYADEYRGIITGEGYDDQSNVDAITTDSFTSAMIRYLRSGRRFDALRHFSLRKAPQWIVANRNELVEQILLRHFSLLVKSITLDENGVPLSLPHHPVIDFARMLVVYFETKAVLRSQLLEMNALVNSDLTDDDKAQISQRIQEIRRGAVKLDEFAREGKAYLRQEIPSHFNLLQRSALMSLTASASSISDDIRRELKTIEQSVWPDGAKEETVGDGDNWPPLANMMARTESTSLSAVGMGYLDSIASQY